MNVDKQALREEFRYMQDHYSDPADRERQEIYIAAEALLDELEHFKSREERVTKLVMDNSTSWDALYKKLEAAEKRTAELERANAAHDDHINQQQDRIDVLEKRNAELGKYAGEMERYCIAYMEWSNKTEWMQNDKRFDVVRPLGKHRADVLREYIKHLEREKDAIEAVALALRDDMRQAREQLEEVETQIVELPRAASVNSQWKPDVCPVTGRRFFMWIEHETLGYVPTYGGPFDSYTIPSRDSSGEFSCERYDHDLGGWVGGEFIGLYLIDDDEQCRVCELEERIAELEKSEEQLINERDHAESALADMYFAATGDRPEWSNWFGFSDAVDAVVDRIAGLEAKQPSPIVPEGLVKAVRFYEQVKRENTPAETGAWKDAIDWVLKEARLAASTLESSREHEVISQQEKA